MRVRVEAALRTMLTNLLQRSSDPEDSTAASGAAVDPKKTQEALGVSGTPELINLTSEVNDDDTREDAEYLQNVLMSMAGSLIVVGPDMKIRMVNTATADLIGYTEPELIGQNINLVMDMGKFVNSTDTLSRRGFIRHGERTYLHKDGSKVPVSFSSAILRDANKRVLGIVCVAQDISNLKRLERELHDRVTQLGILHQVDEELTHLLSVEHVLALGLDIALRLTSAEAGGIALMNRSGKLEVAESLGYPPLSIIDFTGNGIVARVARQQQSALVLDVKSDPQYAPILLTTRAVMAFPLIAQDHVIGVLNLETPDPDHFTQHAYEFVRLVATRVAAAINNAQLYATSQQQIDELRQLYDRVSTLEQMKTDMIRIAAHDLRNPLNNISMSARILQKMTWDKLDDPSRERISDIEQSVERMQKITSNILSLERINKAVTGEFVYAVVDLRSVVQQVYDEHRMQAKTKNQEFILRLVAAPLFVLGDSFELHEAAANFVSNAIKYTPEDGRVLVTLDCTDDYAIFEVLDTGYGIPEDQQPRLFQPFFRAKTEETTKIEGTGLGLHLVKNIIERHRGQVRFKSKRGEGSTFGFQLPLSSASVTTAPSMG